MNSETSDYVNDGQQNSPCPPPLFYGYAGFWKRYAASFIDGVILSVVGALLGFGCVMTQAEIGRASC